MADPPATAGFPSRRTAQAALGAFVLIVLGLVAYRTYSPRLSARPTDDVVLSAPAAKPVDLNTADRAELLQLPGVGPNMADAILSHRSTVGRFDTVDDLGEVKGVGEKTLAKLRPLLTVSDPGVEQLERKKPDQPVTVVVKSGKMQPGDPPIDLNTASEAELLRLPGVGAVKARAIVAARPYKSVDDLDRAAGFGKKTVDSLRPFVKVD